VRAKYRDATTPEDEAAGRAATAYWVAFAASGNPNTKGQPEWPRYTADGDRILDFTLAGPVAKADPWQTRLDLVEALATKGTR
jgi:para-nitrobenzyl esterase